MIIAFNDRTNTIFGRGRDLAELLSGCAHPGVTVVSGRPKMGKSWILTEVARQLQSAHHLVGYAESTGEEADDLLLHSVADAYARWLADAPATEQAKSLYERHKGTLVGRAGQAVGKLFTEIATGTTIEWRAVGEVAAGFFSGLATLDRDLKTAGLTLPRLSYEAARDLTVLLSNLSGRGVVLILDAWDKSPSTDQELGIIDSYLHHLDAWPSGHIVIGLRIESDSDEKVQRVRRLIASSPAAREHKLPLMDLSEEGERERLLRYARGMLGNAVTEASDQEIERWIAGYPGVLEWWERGAVKKELSSPIDIAAAAHDAHAGHYGPEFERVLAPLFEKDLALFGLAVRLALLPELVTEAQWDTLRPVVVEDHEVRALTALQVHGVLDAREPRFPSYGHSTRHEAARRWLITSQYMPFVRQETETLARAVAAQIRGVGRQYYPFTVALIGLRSAVADTSASLASAALVEAAYSLLPDHTVAWEIIRKALPHFRGAAVPTALWSIALLNASKDRSDDSDPDERDVFLAELRDLATRHPDDAAIREPLATALFNTISDLAEEGDRPGRDALLVELHEFATGHSEDAAVRELLAAALFNSIIDRTDEGDLSGREALLAELRDLATCHQDDAAVRELLAEALANAIDYCSQEANRGGQEALLAHLRELVNHHRGDATVRKYFSAALFNSIIERADEGDDIGRGALLVELRNLARSHPEDAAVRKGLTKALLNTIIDRRNDRDRRESLLAELRGLATYHCDDAAVRERLAMALVNTINYRSREGDRDGREALFDELRELATCHSNDTALGKSLAKALFNMIHYRNQEGDRDGREALIAELRDLANRQPYEAEVTTLLEQLSGGGNEADQHPRL